MELSNTYAKIGHFGSDMFVFTTNVAENLSGNAFTISVRETELGNVFVIGVDAATNCTAAVDATRGIVGMNGNALTGTYYTASNGGQTEAGRSLGFNYFQTMLYIITPQVIKATLPTLCNEFIVLLKETSIAGYVGIMDLTKAGDLIRGRTFSAFMPLIAVAAIYLVIVMFLTFVVGKLERRLRNSER